MTAFDGQFYVRKRDEERAKRYPMIGACILFLLAAGYIAYFL